MLKSSMINHTILVYITSLEVVRMFWRPLQWLSADLQTVVEDYLQLHIQMLRVEMGWFTRLKLRRYHLAKVRKSIEFALHTSKNPLLHCCGSHWQGMDTFEWEPLPTLSDDENSYDLSQSIDLPWQASP